MAKKAKYRRDDSPPRRPTPVEEMLSVLIDLEIWTGDIVMFVQDLMRRMEHGRPPEWKGPFNWGDLPPDCDDLDERNKIMGKREGEADELSPTHKVWTGIRDRLYYTVCDWRAAIDTARGLIPGIRKFTDNSSEPPVDRWSAHLQKELSEMGGVIHRLTIGDLPLLDPWTVERLNDGKTKIGQRIDVLKRLGPESSISPKRKKKKKKKKKKSGRTPPTATAHPDKAPLPGGGSRREVREPTWREVPGSGMAWQLARKKAESYVKRHGWLGRNILARQLGCSTPTLDKAVRNSPYLKARQAEAKRPAARSVRANRSGSTPHRDRRGVDPSVAVGIATDDLFARLVDAAEPAEQAKLHAMSPERRAELLQTIRDDPESLRALTRRKHFRQR